MNRGRISSDFVLTLRGLSRGEFAGLEMPDRFWLDGKRFVPAEQVGEVLRDLRGLGFSRESRTGWETIDHPQLGTVQWKSGIDFRTGGEYFFLRINGHVVIKAWPEGGYKSARAEWVGPASEAATEVRRNDVNGRLGRIRW